MDNCRHCHYFPARSDRDGYCSWDCFEHAYPPEHTSTALFDREDRPTPDQPFALAESSTW